MLRRIMKSVGINGLKPRVKINPLNLGRFKQDGQTLFHKIPTYQPAKLSSSFASQGFP